MKKLSTYKSFLESVDKMYSIYDFHIDLLNFDSIQENDVKKYSEKFIGKGVYNRVDVFVEEMFEKFEGIEIEDIEYKLNDVTDELEVDPFSMLAILYCNYEDHYKDNQLKFNGAKGVKDDDKSRKRIKCDILADMIKPTLSKYRVKGPINLRTTLEEIYVSDDKFTCQNFDITNLSQFENIRKELFNYEVDDLMDYDINTFFECYVPGIYIQLKNDDYNYSMNLKKLESALDETLPRVLSDIPHKEIIWDNSRFSRMFDDDTDIYDYTIKIILE